MRRFLFHVTLLLLCVVRISAQQPSPEDYKVYTAVFIEDVEERKDKISSVTIIKKLETDIDDTWLIDMLKDGQQDQLGPNLIMPGNEKLTVPIDTAYWNLVLLFHNTHRQGKLSAQEFHIKEKIDLANSLPIRPNHIDKDWKHYYDAHPLSAGIYAFSDVYYSADGKTAVVYHSIHCHGLCGHGHITVLEKKNMTGK